MPRAGPSFICNASFGRPFDFKVAWSKSQAGKKAPREFVLTGSEFELRTDKDERKKGKIEDKELADLIKGMADSGVATKESKPPAKPVVQLTVSLRTEARTLALDPVKGYGPFGKAVKAVEDLFAKYSK